jgi:hypothetical protein
MATGEMRPHVCTRLMQHAVRINTTVAGWDDAGCYVLATIEPGANIPFYAMVEQAATDRKVRVRYASAYCEHDGIAWLHGTMDEIPFALGFQAEPARQALAAALGSGRLVLTLAPEFRPGETSYTYGKHVILSLHDPMLMYADMVGMVVAASPH